MKTKTNLDLHFFIAKRFMEIRKNLREIHNHPNFRKSTLAKYTDMLLVVERKTDHARCHFENWMFADCLSEVELWERANKKCGITIYYPGEQP